MNLDEIKNLIDRDKGKIIIVENGKPILAVMGFNDYEKIVNGYKDNPFARADEMVDREKSEKDFGLPSDKLKQSAEQDLGAWQTLDKDKKEAKDRYPWRAVEPGINDLSANAGIRETGVSEERMNFFNTPIQAEDKDIELDDLPTM